MTCPANNYFNGSTCVLCSSNLINPAGNSNTSCTPCSSSSNCYTCASYNYAYCLSCNANYYLRNGSCYVCAVSYSFIGNVNAYCFTCSGCYSCIANSTGVGFVCTGCQTNYVIQNGTCIPCPGNQVNPLASTTSTCSACGTSCMNCFFNNPAQCITCPAFTYLYITGSSPSTCQPCAYNQFTPRNNTLTMCSNCLASCYTCASENWTCLTCPMNY